VSGPNVEQTGEPGGAASGGAPYFADLELPIRDWLHDRHIDFMLREDAADSLVLRLSPHVAALVAAAEEREAAKERERIAADLDKRAREDSDDDARTTHATHAD
jgi:hypothetical protein